jgi:Carbohydrate binding domain (family 11)
MKHAPAAVFVLATLVASCTPSGSTSAPEAPPAASASAESAPRAMGVPAPIASASRTPTPAHAHNCELIAADSGLIDDCEDGDYRIPDAGGREGGWMAHHDNRGSVMAIPKTVPLVMDNGGALGSKRAIHAKGKAASGEGTMAFINLLLHSGDFYDASKYRGISFWAKSAIPSAHLRFRVSDINTAEEGKICKVCWNDFGKTVELTDAWTEYKMSFDELAQRDGPADPQLPHLEASKLFALAWDAEPGKEFDFWVDQVSFLACKE